MVQFGVRPAAPEDGAAIGKAHATAWLHAYGNIFDAEFLGASATGRRAGWPHIIEALLADEGIFLVGEFNGEVVAFAHAGPDRKSTAAAEIYGFYGHPSSWGTGLASVLMAAICAQLVQDWDRVVLWTHRDARRARRFYEKCGFEATGRSRVETMGDWQSDTTAPATTVEYARPLVAVDETGGRTGAVVHRELRAARRDPIVIAPYDSGWPGLFERERERIVPVLGPWTVGPIEHIGSTAVPGLSAKSIIDMLAVVADIDQARNAIEPMRIVGWEHAPEPLDEAERRLSFCYPSVERRSHHLHVVEEHAEGWREWLMFRDYLHRHEDVAREYGAVKARLAAEHGQDPNEREVYRAGKSDLIRRINQVARADEHPNL